MVFDALNGVGRIPQSNPILSTNTFTFDDGDWGSLNGLTNYDQIFVRTFNTITPSFLAMIQGSVVPRQSGTPRYATNAKITISVDSNPVLTYFLPYDSDASADWTSLNQAIPLSIWIPGGTHTVSLRLQIDSTNGNYQFAQKTTVFTAAA